MHREGKFDNKAQALDCEPVAELIFNYWTEEENRPQDRPRGRPGLKQCLAHFSAITYIGASRPGETLYVTFDLLNQRRCSVNMLRTKSRTAAGKIPEENVYWSEARPEEQTNWARVWKLLLLDKCLLFAGEQWRDVNEQGLDRRWVEVEKINFHAAIGKGKEYVDMQGRPTKVKGYIFRHSRCVHLLGHGLVTKEDLSEKLGHKEFETLKKYIAGTGRDLGSFRGQLKLKDGVVAVLRRRLDSYYAQWRRSAVLDLAAKVDSTRRGALAIEDVKDILDLVPQHMLKHFGLIEGKRDVLHQASPDLNRVLVKVEELLAFMQWFYQTFQEEAASQDAKHMAAAAAASTEKMPVRACKTTPHDIAPTPAKRKAEATPDSTAKMSAPRLRLRRKTSDPSAQLALAP
jgi:hypothetical protein